MVSERMLGAISFMIAAHGSQKRKFTGEPYAVHPLEVATILNKTLHDDISEELREDIIIGGLFHDLVEDTSVTLLQISSKFGRNVSMLVSEVTDVSTPEHGNRAARKAMDRAHLSHSSKWGATIKLADLISNTSDIVANDPNFAKVYLQEKELLLQVLQHGHPALVKLASVNMLKELSAEIATLSAG
jgi:(p)ppGpp synthase/HD superfamily hydrolase